MLLILINATMLHYKSSCITSPFKFSNQYRSYLTPVIKLFNIDLYLHIVQAVFSVSLVCHCVNAMNKLANTNYSWLIFNGSCNRVWKGFRVIRELTKKQSVNRENSWNTAVIRELYIHCDA